MAILEATREAVAAAGAALRGGALVAFPTETVYGLGADASNGRAVAAIFAAKGRPRFNPLIVHVPDIDAVARLGRLTHSGRQLAAAFWPGPLTLVMAKQQACPVADLATAGLDTIALRVPAHPVAQALLRAADRPIAAPSANRSGHVSPTTAAHVEADLGGQRRHHPGRRAGADRAGIDGGGRDRRGAGDPAPGRRSRARASRASLGRPVALAQGEPGKPASPGMLARHYAPAARLRLDAREVRDGRGAAGLRARGARSMPAP